MDKDKRAKSEELLLEVKESMLNDVLNTFKNEKSTLSEKTTAINVLKAAIELHSLV